jgi:phage-related holin
MTTETVITKTLGYFITGISAFFLPIHWAFWVVIAFVAVDTITGVMAAGKDSVKDIKSRKLFGLVPKTIFYFLLVIVAHSASYIDNQIPFVKLAMFGIGFIEVKSIDENFEKLYGFSFVNKILDALKHLKKVNR